MGGISFGEIPSFYAHTAIRMVGTSRIGMEIYLSPAVPHRGRCLSGIAFRTI